MDYKAMWEKLKSKIESDLKYYKNGAGCSWGEAVAGEKHYKEMLRTMETLEEKYQDF